VKQLAAKQPGDVATPPESRQLDVAFLLRLAADIGADGVVEMIGIFLEDAPLRMTAIHRAMAAGAIPTVRREAHALAGAAGNVGLNRLRQAAAALEHACEQAGPDAAAIERLAAMLRDGIPLLIGWAAAREGMAVDGPVDRPV
jgi:HPt (histidine-containing phosphotransfer) domain-containing protein